MTQQDGQSARTQRRGSDASGERRRALPCTDAFERSAPRSQTGASVALRRARRRALAQVARGLLAGVGLVSAAGALVGCAAGMMRPVTPRVTLVDLQLLESTLLEGRFRARLRVQNPNNVALQFRGLQFALDVNGLSLAQGATPRTIDLPRLGESLVDVDFSVGALNVVRQVLAWRDRAEPIDYVLRGTLFTTGNRGLSFRETGRLSLV